MSNTGEVSVPKSPDWLPAGWTIEVKSKNGRNIKSYIEPLKGYRFYSKPKVLEYIGTVEKGSCTPQKETTGIDSDVKLQETPAWLPHGSVTESTSHENGPQNGNQVVAGKVSESGKVFVEKVPNWLPSGWTVEVKEKNGRNIRTYIDQQTGHRFYSKPQVLGYLGTVTNSWTSPKDSGANNSDGNLPQLPDGSVMMTTPRENGSQGTKNYKLEASNASHSGHKEAEMSPDWLPAGWTEDVQERNGRKIKSYVDSVTGRKFYSKPKVLEYLGTARMDSGKSEKKNAGNDYDINLLPKTIDSPQALPDGWITEVKPRGGSRGGKYYKQYIDPLTGRKFFSMQKVFEYLAAVKPKNGTPPQGKTGLDSISSLNMDKIGGETPIPQLGGSKNMNPLNLSGNTSTSMETSSSKQPGGKLSPEGLPPGWKKEIKFQKKSNGTKRITYYIDPVSGYVFSSLKDVFRYLEAGDISKCAKKPKKKEELGFATEQNPQNMDKTGGETPSAVLVGAKSVNTRKRVRFSYEEEKMSSRQNMDNNGGETPSALLSVTKTVNTRRRVQFSSEEDKLSSSKKIVTTRSRARLSSEDEKMSSGEQSNNEVMVERVAAEGLPPGWIKEVKIAKYYTDPRSGFVFTSQKDALRYIETGDINKCAVKPRNRDELGLNEGSSSKINITEEEPPLKLLEGSRNANTRKGSKSSNTPTSFSSPQKGTSTRKLPGGETVIERVAPEGLPPGWIKEIRIQNKGSGIRRDPFYTDPVSGYVFSSQKDVLRYIETGDPSSCAIKPKNREQLGLDQGSSVTSPVVVKKSGRDTDRKQLFAGDRQVSPKRSLDTVDTDVSQKRRQTRSTASAINIHTPTVELPKETTPLNDVVEKPTEPKKHNHSSRKLLSETKGSKKKQGTIISPPSTKNSRKEKVKRNAMKSNSASKPKKKDKLRTPPSRSSKRILGLKSETVPNSGPSKQFLVADAGESGKNKDNLFSNSPIIAFHVAANDVPHSTLNDMAGDASHEAVPEITETHVAEAEKSNNEDNPSPKSHNDVLHDGPQQLETVPPMGETNVTLGVEEAASNAEVSNKRKEPMEDRAEDQINAQEQPLYQFGEESWADPCLDFAFKTLTGTIPFEDNVPVPNIFQPRVDPNPAQTSDNCLTLLDFGAPSFRQVDSSHAQSGPEAPSKPETVAQSPPSRPILPDINSSLTSGGEYATQQIDLEGDKNYFKQG